MLKISAFGNAENNLSITDLAYPIGCEVSEANAVLRKHYVTIVNTGEVNADFSISNRGLFQRIFQIIYPIIF
jgi:hypothetical protein